jgi:hypothetical protein
VRWPRARTIANAALLVVLSLMCGSIVAGLNGWYEEKDFNCWWVAGRIAANGGDPYDAQQFAPIIRTLPPSEARALHRCGQRLTYPPWTGAALAPFGALPLPAASSLWASLAVLAAVLGIHWTRLLSGLRRLSWTLVLALVVGTQPFMRVFEEGQFATFIFALTAGAALAMRSKNDVVAGIATAALALKPHTAIGFAGVLMGLALFRRRWRLVGAAAVSGLGLAGLTQLLRPGWLVASVGASTSLSGAIPDRATIWNLAGSSALAIVTIGLLLAAVVVLIRPRRADEAEILGLAVAFGLVVAPYVWDHDLLVLAIPWFMIVAHASRLQPLPRRALTITTLLIAAPLTWILWAVANLRGGPQSLSVLLPILTAVLLALAIRWAPSPQANAGQPAAA